MNWTKSTEVGNVRISRRFTLWFFIGKDHFNLHLPNFRVDWWGMKEYTYYSETNFIFELSLIVFGISYNYTKRIDKDEQTS